MIPFNKPTLTGNEQQYVIEAIKGKTLSGNGEFGQKCQEWFEKNIGCSKAFLTPSCTHALEMAALLIDIKPGDEVIMPSYTFVSTANAFVLRGAKIVFVDIRPDTMNIDEQLIEAAVSSRTKAIVPVHYAGVSCEMDEIMSIANRHGLYVIEDAAQCVAATYKGKPLGTIGHLGTYSFHETKNLTSGGEGGLLIINDEQFIERAEIIREKGTDRTNYFRGMVDKYSWIDIGSSYLPSELQAAFLWAQLEMVNAISDDRYVSWNKYYEGLSELEEKGFIELPKIASGCHHNAHMFYIKLRDYKKRDELIKYLNLSSIMAIFHYVPLHSSAGGKKYGRFSGEDTYTSIESERLLRLPMFFGLKGKEIEKVVSNIKNYFL